MPSSELEDILQEEPKCANDKNHCGGQEKKQPEGAESVAEVCPAVGRADGVDG